jgi:hypothetical protein
VGGSTLAKGRELVDSMLDGRLQMATPILSGLSRRISRRGSGDAVGMEAAATAATAAAGAVPGAGARPRSCSIPTNAQGPPSAAAPSPGGKLLSKLGGLGRALQQQLPGTQAPPAHTQSSDS